MNFTPEPLGTVGPVRIVGTGLIGASIGLALSTRGASVLLEDASPTNALIAEHMGAGLRAEGSDIDPASVKLVVVAAPPDVCAKVITDELENYPNAVVTDVASVKSSILHELEQAGVDTSRYLGSHPMGGRERSGPTAAHAELFRGRPWVLCPHSGSSQAAVLSLRTLTSDLGAMPVVMPPVDHDRAVALVSHVPQVISSLMAAQLRDASPVALELAGQGLRDITRIAASDPGMWTQILAANRTPVAEILSNLRDSLDEILDGLNTARLDQQFAGLTTIAATISAGNAGHELIPGKHGSGHTHYETLLVLVPDEPGQLGRLFAEAGEAGINIEDFSLEHSPNQPAGVARLSVLAGQRDRVETALSARGWTIAG